MLALEALKPSAMFPWLSDAMLPIQRQYLVSEVGRLLFSRWRILLLPRKRYEMVWVARWWRNDAIQVGRQEEWVARVADNPWSLSGGSAIACQHLRPIKHKRLRSE